MKVLQTEFCAINVIITITGSTKTIKRKHGACSVAVLHPSWSQASRQPVIICSFSSLWYLMSPQWLPQSASLQSRTVILVPSSEEKMTDTVNNYLFCRVFLELCALKWVFKKILVKLNKISENWSTSKKDEQELQIFAQNNPKRSPWAHKKYRQCRMES